MPSAELQAALDAANAAAAVIRSLYQRNLEVVTKADKSPVTEADVKSEQAIHEVLSKRFPGYGFYGEETGQHDMGAESIWLVDPIDGTKSFVRDCPFFSTQIALLRGGRFVLGVSCAPVYGELAWAERGQGAWLDGKPVKVSTIDTIEGAALSAGNLKTLASGPQWATYGKIVSRVNRAMSMPSSPISRAMSSAVARSLSMIAVARRSLRSSWIRPSASRTSSVDGVGP